MTDTDKTVAVFVEKENGEKVQVGWATPDQNGIRRVNLFEEYNNTATIRDVKFADVTPFEATADPQDEQAEPRTFEDSQQTFVDIDGDVIDEAPLPAAPVEDVPDEEQAADPIEDAPDSEEADDPTENEPEVIEGELEDDADDVEDVPEEFSPAPAVQEENSEQQ